MTAFPQPYADTLSRIAAKERRATRENPQRPDQPARASNIAAIVSFYESGIKPSGADERIGIELEHIIVHDDGRPVSYSGEHGVEELLGLLVKEYPRTTCDPQGDLLGVARPGEAVTIEPAAQLELSAGPFSDLDTARAAFLSFEQHVDAILGPWGERLCNVGYHPTAKARSLELIPKRRYQFMNMYLGERDSEGVCMMRGSASTQVSIDFVSVPDCLRKLRLAFSLCPLFALMADNAPMFEGQPHTHQMMRTSMWQHTDPDRCGLVPGALDPAFTLEDYASYILDTPAILVSCTTNQWCFEDRTFGQIYANRTMTPAEVEHAVSMFFTDVRLKNYVEIRPADSMPIPFAIAYAALVKGVFYSDENLEALDELLGTVTDEDYVAAQESLMQNGYDGIIYGRTAAELADTVVALAKQGLAQGELGHLVPLEELVSQRKTLADLESL